MMKKFIFFLLTLLYFNQTIYAQLDKQHWFAPMYDRVGNNYQYQSVYLSTNRIEPFNVKIYNNNNLLTTVSVSKGNPIKYDIGTRNIIITTNSNDLFKPVKKGLYLEAEYPFYANLRFSEMNHAEIITSKGTAGIGNEFYAVVAPVKVLTNSWLYNYVYNFMTSILATEDDTTIKINGYDKNIIFSDNLKHDEFNITLNKGESYIIEGVGNTTDSNFTGFIGAKITSNKPISVTNGNFNGQYAGDYNTSSDILMDQSVPIDVLGNEFVLVKGNGTIGSNMEGAIVLATKDYTQIYLNNEDLPIATINAGEYYIVEDTKYQGQGTFLNNHYNLYIKTSENAYVYQLLAGDSGDSSVATGGMNFIPALNCFLPKSIDEIGLIDENYVYSNNVPGRLNIPTRLNIITEKNGQVKVNGVTPNSNYGPFNIIGNPDWVTYGIPNISGNVTITSDKAVTAGITAGSDAVGYGGFFAGLPTNPSIVAEDCFPNAILRVIPEIFETYQWYKDGIPISGATNGTYKPTDRGYYSVEVTIGTCDPLTAEFKLKNCPYEKEVNLKTCKAPLHFIPIFTTSTQSIDYTSVDILEQPTKGSLSIDPVTGEIIYTPKLGEVGLDEFQYQFCGMSEFEDCEIVTVKIEITELILNNQTLYSCNIENSGIFDLTDANITQDTDVTYNYYPTYDDALNEVKSNEILNFTNFESSDNNIIYVLVKNSTGCSEISEIKLELYELPKIDLSTYQQEFCSTSIFIDFDKLTNQIVKNNESFIIKYYLNEADALLGNTNNINLTQQSFSENINIFLRIESPNACSPVIEKLNFYFGERVKLTNTNQTKEYCDDDFDGIVTLNLDDLTNDFTDISNTTLTYFESIEDAQTNLNPIASNQTINQTKTIYIRFEHPDYCINFAELTINIKTPLKSETLLDQTICAESTAELDPGDDYDSYLWSTGETTQTVVVGVGSYWVDLTYEGCTYREFISIDAYDMPIIQEIKVFDNQVIINVSGGKAPYRYSLDGINWQDQNTFIIPTNGVYTVYVISADNCTPVTKEFIIFRIPNYVTPNGDGINDKWTLKLTGYKNVDIHIFDRYGNTIIKQKFNDEFIWDGKMNGIKLTSTTYWYTITLEDGQITSGNITVKNK